MRCGSASQALKMPLKLDPNNPCQFEAHLLLSEKKTLLKRGARCSMLFRQDLLYSENDMSECLRGVDGPLAFRTKASSGGREG